MACATLNCTEDKATAQIQITIITYFALLFVNRDLKGKDTARNLSIPIAIFVNTLPETENNCTNSTIGHIGFENIHVFSIV